MITKKKKIVIVGGGFFGLYIAEYASKLGHEVILFEKEDDFMKRASYNNQARVHNGYHYPRSILTALRSRISFPKFCDEFPEAIDQNFTKYYLIGKVFTKVNAKQFKQFCDRIGAPCDIAEDYVMGLCNKRLVEQVFKTKEFAFDSVKLKQAIHNRVKKVNVQILLKTSVVKVVRCKNNLEVYFKNKESNVVDMVEADEVFNCTYSMLNFVNANSNFKFIPLKHEVTEMCLVQVPDLLKSVGLTMMCGPFFSVMPFPHRSLHTFSHVRYTPHYEWMEKDSTPYLNPHRHMSQNYPDSKWRYMYNDAKRYLPILEECKYKESLYEIKTILPRSEVDDSRPILFKVNYDGIKGMHHVLGGKIDNVYDIIQAIKGEGIL